MSEEKATIAGVILSDEQGRFLLVQEARENVRGLWNLPAGHVGPGETIQDAAVRESREEVGLEVELLGERPILSSHDEKEGLPLHSFLARVVGGKLNFDQSEIREARYLTFAEVEDLFKADQLRSRWVIESIKRAVDANSRH